MLTEFLAPWQVGIVFVQKIEDDWLQIAILFTYNTLFLIWHRRKRDKTMPISRRVLLNEFIVLMNAEAYTDWTCSLHSMFWTNEWWESVLIFIYGTV